LAILKRIANKSGDGAGRSRYIVRKAVEIRTDIPSYISLLSGERPTPELRKEIANEYNRFLLVHQGDYRTQHFIVSFGHFLSDKEIEKVLDLLQEIFDDSLRYHLFAVHVEEHGTAFHIVESASPDGKLRHLNQKEFHELKRKIIKELSPFMNEKEKKTARNYHRGISTQDWMSEIEIHAPERSWKVYIRKAVLEASKLISNGEIEKAIDFLESRGIEIQEIEPGKLSPYGRILRRKRTYAVYRHPQKGIIAVPLDKKMKATFQAYQNAIQEYYRGLKEIERIIEENIPGTERPGTSEGGTGERNQESGREEEIYIADLDLFIPTEGGTGEEDRKTQTGEEEKRDGTFRDRDKYRESGDSEEHSFYPDRREERRAERFRSEHSQEESGTRYCQSEAPGTTKRREETEKVEEDKPANGSFLDIQLGSELLPLHPTPQGRTAYPGNEADSGTGNGAAGKEPSAPENDFTTPEEHYPTEEEEFTTPEESLITSEEKLTTSEKPDTDTRPIESLPEERDYGESGRTLESEDSGRRGRSVLHPDSREISDIPRRERQLGNSQRPLQNMHPSPEQRKWTINGEEVTEDDIRGNPALYTKCEIEEVRKLAWDYLIEEIDEEVEFLERMGYFKDIEEIERLEIEEAERKEVEEDKGMDFGL
jgi:hypothetical protein